jgi:dTMP kinase
MKQIPLAGRNPFVVLEGGDGSGKTSVRKHLFARLREQNVVALSTIPVSWLIPESTEVITKAKYFNYKFPPQTILRAYVRDKEELTRRLLEPHLPWRPVICDRFVLSDIVYNELLYSIPVAETAEAYRASSVIEPDFMIFMDTPPEVAVARLDKRFQTQRHEWETFEKQQRIYAAFSGVLQQNPAGLKVKVLRLDNSGGLEETLQQVDSLVVPEILGAVRKF